MVVWAALTGIVQLKKQVLGFKRKKWHAAQIDVCNRLPGTLSCFAALLKRLLVAIFVPDSAHVSQSPFSLLARQQHKSDGKKKYIYIHRNKLLSTYIYILLKFALAAACC